MDSNRAFLSEKTKTLVLPNLSYQIYGVLFSVHNELGPFLLEKYYQRAIEKELEDVRLSFKKEYPVNIEYRQKVIGRYFLDFVIENLIVVEVKAQKNIPPKFNNQVLAYLRQTELPLAIIANFRSDRLLTKRIVNPFFKEEDLTPLDKRYDLRSKLSVSKIGVS
jgi:GxxExxY protein